MPEIRPCIRVVLVAVLALSRTVGCSSGSAADDSGVADPPPAACLPSERPLPDGRCQPAGLPIDMPCAPGELELEGGGCQPAGVPAEACAAGFVADGRGGCDAIVPSDICPAGTMAVPGESACREVAPCGAGRWGELPTVASTQFVDQAYTRGDSDGSSERPWTTIQEGIAAAAPGGIVAVAEGRYAEDLMISRKPVRLWGRCPRLVELSARGARNAALEINGESASGSELRGLAVSSPVIGVFLVGARSVIIDEVRVHDAELGGVFLLSAASMTMRDSLVERSRMAGVGVWGSEATVERSVVRASRPGASDGAGVGIHVQADPYTRERSTVVVRSSLVERNHLLGIAVLGSDATIEGSVMRNTQPIVPSGPGGGIGVQFDQTTRQSGALIVRSSLLERNRVAGIAIVGAKATVEGSVVRDTRPGNEKVVGIGVQVYDDALSGERGSLSLRTSLLERNCELGVQVLGSDATIAASVVRGTQSSDDLAGGVGVSVEVDPNTRLRSALRLQASLVEENQGHGVLVDGSEATIDASAVRRTQRARSGSFGRGVSVMDHVASDLPGVLLLRSSLVEQNHEVGVVVSSAEATIESSVVRGTQPSLSGTFGRGVSAQDGGGTGRPAVLTLRSSLIEQNHESGVLLIGAEATVESSVVRGTQPSPAGVSFGDGFAAVEGNAPSSVVAKDTELLDNARAGLLIVGSTGHIAALSASRNRFGLVLQQGRSGATPVIGEDNLFEGNTEQEKLVGSDLPVPLATPPLP